MLKTGDVVDRYEIVGLLGKGGMGEVYRAHDLRLERDVALKILHADTNGPRSSASEQAAARLLREARAVALLEHPNVVAVYDVGVVDKPEELHGTTYLAMELIKGRSLRDYLTNWPVPLAQRVRWLADIARALGAAHARGLVHRDVKPENVMIREDGVVKVLDFGIAKRTVTLQGTSATPQAQVIPTITTQGFIIGTPHYMAPEHMRGEPIDGRADQFSWGVVAYEALCGKLPWHPEDGDTLQLVAQVLSMDAEGLVIQNPDVPPEIAAVVMRALSKSREDRFPTMEDLVVTLEGKTAEISAMPTITRNVPIPMAPATATRKRAIPWALLLVALAAGAAGAALALRSRAPPEVAPAASTDARSASGCVSSAACIKAHDGAAYTCRHGDGQCVALGSDDCRVLAEPMDLQNDDTVWVGSLYPLSGPDAPSFGVVESQAVDLARQDFAQAMAGLTGSRAQGVVHPIGLVSCDDAVDPARAARHLALDVKVPGVIGFRTSAEAVDLASSMFLPHGVMTVVALNTSSQIASIPQPPGPRLVWRTTYNMSETAVPVSLLVANNVEPALREGGVREPIRVALARPKNIGALGFSSRLFDRLSFNEKSALENGANYREFVWADGEHRAEGLAEAAKGLASFAPHVVIFQGDDNVIKLVFEPLEASWPAARRYRPTYITMTVLTPEVFRFAGKDASRRKRFFGLTTVSTTPANARFVMHYNEIYKERITRTISPNSSYDAFYVLAYAVLANGDRPVTGANLASSVSRLVPPGTPVETGPTGILDAFTLLKNGQKIDLTGATGKLDFDLASGQAPVDQAILCVDVDPEKRAYDSVESGLVYSASSGKLEGTMRCP